VTPTPQDDLPLGAWDGHTHSGLCPHGSGEPTAGFVERAAALGIRRWSITEHAPFPAGFKDPSPKPTSALPPGDLERYLSEAEGLRERHADSIEVRVGLEVDYLPGLESETRALLDAVGPRLEDALLSVHFIPVPGGWACVDWSPSNFRSGALAALGSIEAVHAAYWDTLLAAAEADLGPRGPRRIGHLTQVFVFRTAVGEPDEAWTLERAEPVLRAIAARGLALDLNVSRWRHPEMGLPHPLPSVLARALELEIPLVYGSDAHAVRAVGRDRDAARTLVGDLAPG